MNLATVAALAAAIEALSSGHARVLASELRAQLESASTAAPENVHSTRNVTERDARYDRYANRGAAARMRRYRARKKTRDFESLQLDLAGPGFGVTDPRNGPASSSSLDLLTSEEEDRATVTHDTVLDADLVAIAAGILADRGVELSVPLAWTAFRLHHHGATFKRSRLLAAWGRWVRHERPAKPDEQPGPARASPRGMSPAVRVVEAPPLPREELRERLALLAAGIA